MHSIIYALRRKLDAFNHDEGTPKSVYDDVHDWIEENFGKDASEFFSRVVDATDGSFYFKEDPEVADLIDHYSRVITYLMVSAIFPDERDNENQVLLYTGIWKQKKDIYRDHPEEKAR